MNVSYHSGSLLVELRVLVLVLPPPPSLLLPPSLIQAMWSSQPAYRRWPWEKLILSWWFCIFMPIDYWLSYIKWDKQKSWQRHGIKTVLFTQKLVIPLGRTTLQQKILILYNFLQDITKVSRLCYSVLNECSQYGRNFE